MVKRVTELSGLREIRTLHSSKKRVIPRVLTSAYLDLYMLRKEEERLEKEDAILEKRKAAIQRRLDDIKKETEILKALEQNGQQADRKDVAEEESQEKKWKKMGLSY